MPMSVPAPPAAGGPLNNYAATRAPTSTDDANAGFSAGSTWRWGARPAAWECDDPTPNAARWRLVRHLLSPYSQTVGAIYGQGGANPGGTFGGSNVVSAGNFNNLTGSGATEYASSFTTSATASAEARLVYDLSANPLSIIVPATGGPVVSPLRAVTIKFALPDTSYGSGSTGVRFAVGLFSYIGSNSAALGPTGDPGSGNSSANGVWFRVGTTASESTFKLVNRPDATNLATATVVDTGVPWTLNNTDPIEAVFAAEGPGLLRWALRRSSGDQMATGLVTVGFSSAAQFNAAGIQMRTLDAVARTFRWGSVLVMERPL